MPAENALPKSKTLQEMPITMKIKDIKTNPDNPRIIRDKKFEKLKDSIRSFPQMMELRPIVIDEDGIILGGNMRFEAIKNIGYKEIPDNWVVRREDLTESQKKEFVIKDNASFGEWDWDVIANEWDVQKLDEWGVSLWTADEDVSAATFDPELKPSFDTSEVTEEEIKKNADALAKQMFKEIMDRGVICPECNHEFTVSI